ncbi:H(+)/Cl(-) exchange transporter ClcA [Paraburkholderia sp. PGU19]|uniref:H(+)/Cl(-) exchange transporter ClcA n=1 Tax=Paraburkholderia sp. PGU19 TaxID=2735434 RepID=UPI0015DB53EA|nr:H(+)/Cl(-) exchange transporter ClcA [Paraburkholderia sp. PGU19]
MDDTGAGKHSHGLVMLAASALLAGTACGLIGTLFRFSLESADRVRNVFIGWAHTEHLVGFMGVLLATSAATAFAANLVRRRAPHAIGSGIPHVEAVVSGDLPPAPLALVPVKFVGGVIAIGAGLALGREGPTVQMASTISNWIGTLLRRNADDCRILIAAGAGAGLATAFNAPIAGAVFVLEELLRRFDMRTAVAALGASAGAIAVARLMHGDAPDFQFGVPPHPGFGTVPVYLLLGAVTGLLGAAYCRAILWALAIADWLSHWPVYVRGALIGAAAGVLAWYAPDLAGGGDPLTQRALLGAGELSGVAVAFVIRFGFGALSYAAGTPGGLFAPMLVLGAQAGLSFGRIGLLWFPGFAADPGAFAAVGMTAFFAAVVRAPVTGIVLVTEMTGGFTLLLPMLTACFTAMVVPVMLHCPPIYDSLGERLPHKASQVVRPAR